MEQIDQNVKSQVRAFYDSIGWKQIADGVYQNARYEDLRPVSREYIHRCHLRVARHIPTSGRFMLDAGSGPIQYPEYLEYSRGYQYRVCLDISQRALVEAKKRIADHGLYVVGDIANLPFKPGVFDGLISLHAVHHLPSQEQGRAFREFYRVLSAGGRAVVVYSWGKASPLMRLAQPFVRLGFAAIRLFRRLRRLAFSQQIPVEGLKPEAETLLSVGGSYTHKHSFRWMARNVGDLPGFEVRVWRSVNTSFLRALIHRKALGVFWLRLLFALEERAPRFFGRVGLHPMILFHKPESGASERG